MWSKLKCVCVQGKCQIHVSCVFYEWATKYAFANPKRNKFVNIIQMISTGRDNRIKFHK